MPIPEAIRHVGLLFSPDIPNPQPRYSIDETHWRPLTAEEATELETMEYRSSRDWCSANWGTDRNAFEVELDASRADVGSVVINFETAWSPPVRVLERLQQMFSDLAFSCGWFPEDELFYRYHPGRSTAVARSEQRRPGEHVIATLYLTKAENPEFFLETRIIEEAGSEYPREGSKVQRMSEEEAHLWMLAPEVTLLALLYPELPEAAETSQLSPARLQ
jgi:hypothetical protein